MSSVLSCDLLVVGAGPAGIAAAAVAAEGGLRVVIADEGREPGGQIWRAAAGKRPAGAARAWLARLRRSGAQLEPRLSIVQAEPSGRALGERDGQPVVVEAPRIAVATGARERFLPFPGWTLPGVLGAGGAQALWKGGASFAGRRVVVAGSGPLLLPVAASLARGGAQIAVVAEQAPAPAIAGFGLSLWRQPGKIREAVRCLASSRARYRTGVWVVAAEGRDEVEAAVLTDGRRTWREPCDVLACGFGLVPNLELARSLGCTVEDGVVRVDDQQRTSVEGVWAAGEPTGIGGVERSLLQGQIAGLSASGSPVPPRLHWRLRSANAFVGRLARAFTLRPELRGLARPDTLVCRCEDVALGRIDPRWTRRQCKLYTRAGMGACQGRICGPALEFLFGVGPDKERPPLAPVRLSTLEEFR